MWFSYHDHSLLSQFLAIIITRRPANREVVKAKVAKFCALDCKAIIFDGQSSIKLPSTPWIGMKPCMGVRTFLISWKGFFLENEVIQVFQVPPAPFPTKKFDFWQWWTSASQCASQKLFWLSDIIIFLKMEWFDIQYMSFKSFLVWHPSNQNVGNYASQLPESWTKAYICRN